MKKAFARQLKIQKWLSEVEIQLLYFHVCYHICMWCCLSAWSFHIFAKIRYKIRCKNRYKILCKKSVTDKTIIHTHTSIYIHNQIQHSCQFVFKRSKYFFRFFESIGSFMKIYRKHTINLNVKNVFHAVTADVASEWYGGVISILNLRRTRNKDLYYSTSPFHYRDFPNSFHHGCYFVQNPTQTPSAEWEGQGQIPS